MDFDNQNTICMIYVQHLLIIKLFTKFQQFSSKTANDGSITLPKAVLKLLIMENPLETGSYMISVDVMIVFRSIEYGKTHHFRGKCFFSKVLRLSFDLLWFSFDLAAPGAPPGGNRC